jgi:hypothetical protein
VTELVTIDYVIARSGLHKSNSYRYLRVRGVKATYILGIYHYSKDEVDRALNGYVKRTKRQNSQVSYFTFNDFQMEIIRFCRGDYAPKGIGFGVSDGC